jgi:xylan 1,4-beta-xylosidase
MVKLISSLFFYLLLPVWGFSQQLVLPGDYPDPSVVKIRNTYWATATTSNWAPAYPILKSKDLVKWETVSHAFFKLPEWADYYFWAPEITYDNGKVYLYYSAHKKDGNLCLGVASADRPEGPYTDLGPLMCQEVGSIDAFPMRDADGKLFMIWKEDGNSVGKPTPIWAMEMKEDRTGLIGEKKELFRNDQPWENNLVEGVSMMRHGEYIYAFYAAAGCCGNGCTYVSGVARAKNLLGPWEKYKQNPVLTNTNDWICPGHGTPVEKDGRYYFMYHAYDKETNAFTGRQGLLQEFTFTPDGWISFIKNNNSADKQRLKSVRDQFSRNNLSDKWQWSVFQQTKKEIRKGRLQLQALPDPSGAFVGTKTLSGDYQATVELFTLPSTAKSGIGAIGDEKNTLTLFYNAGQLTLEQLKDSKANVLNTITIQPNQKLLLRMQANQGKMFTFSYSVDGKTFTTINKEPVNGSYLPPWDRAIRVGLVAKGNTSTVSVFDNFELKL